MGATVKMALQVTLLVQLLLPVKITVFDPLHSDGAPVLLFVITGLQPPPIVADINQLLKIVSISA